MLFSAERKELTKSRQRLFRKLKRLKLKQVMNDWMDEQHCRDVQQQLRGEPFQEPALEESRPMKPMQRTMVDALNAPLVDDFEAVFKRRTNAILALVAYCSEDDPLHTKVTEARKQPPPVELQRTDLSPKDRLHMIRQSVYAGHIGEGQVRRCFLCVTKACNILGPTHLIFDDLCRSFYSVHTLARHFIGTHLNSLPEDESFECPLCLIPLLHQDHLRLHSHNVHSIPINGVKEIKHNED